MEAFEKSMPYLDLGTAAHGIEDCQARPTCLWDQWSISSLCSRRNNSNDIHFLRQPTRDDLVAFHTSQAGFAVDNPNESHMDAADCSMTQPFRDFRSAARAKQRSRRLRLNIGSCHSYKCRKSGQAAARSDNTRNKRDHLQHELWMSQKCEQGYTLGFQKTKHMYIEWDVKLPEEFDEYIENMDDEIVRYERLHKNANIFESHESYTEVGESISAWCQRRIEEMRAVKKYRSEKAEHVVPSACMSNSLDMSRRYTPETYIDTDALLNTILPTSSDDALGLTLLRKLVTHHEFHRHFRCLNGELTFGSISKSGWFGEYEWAWHRNMSGCWELGYKGCSERADNAPIPCSCCCTGNGSMYWPCYCKDFRDGEGWMSPAPEELQRCSLVEWVGLEGRRVILIEMMQIERDGVRPGEMEAAESQSEWEWVSCGSSDTWSEVDAEQAIPL